MWYEIIADILFVLAVSAVFGIFAGFFISAGRGGDDY